ncbi:UDP-N-acetylmuramoyl-L-alanyl-D-glutamate--2,6-diaminopimelate ligase [Paenibacillus thermoaerophilus]|uniref:UDP-N-acetylmuramoyl-L-alanyl-D-glutamate--2,6-diaminopimelate ligase n=1 Tax=Paenibacillus thermoaerophilus TaxID=1215385 RepID=A0ABW2V1L1_9BACL|nr:UDP-N-acetylmuramoyl-L-alanyl-D-glutamate--2,6-diaminopimelate ligase [Paenibacillus thermoaerophilus]TMV19217.1 UDP-N-acetylmuramoyl-L-alanyl-D-glutamate--2,6-diaminopimelate ligase [Paenibacillus thermoaerophilus]
MKLNELASRLVTGRLEGSGDVSVGGIAIDNRQVRPGDLFICIPGAKFDGHDFAADAVKAGAVAVVAERDVDVPVPKLFVRDARRALPALAAHLYGYPSRELSLVAITGTNGKTTTSFLLERILADAGRTTGLMGNIGMKIGDRFIRKEGINTRESHDLQRALREMRDAGVDVCVMEATSQGLHKGRMIGCNIRTAVFTNLTQDHLDYHGTMDAYMQAKGLLFARMGNADGDRPKYAVLNGDDPASDYFRSVTAAETVTYGLSPHCDVRADNVRLEAGGTAFDVTAFGETRTARIRLIGLFNVYNALAAVTAALLEGVPLDGALASLAGIPSVEGRMETVDEGQPYLVVVDYAHTPDGLYNALNALREVARRRILTVFGCGGDRDRSKRPIMGEIAARYSDYVVVTSDNPRYEDPEAILRDIEPGILRVEGSAGRYALVADRRAAIEKAVEMASPEDVVLIAGKGHETYQTVRGVSLPFDDREVARAAIRKAAGR